MISNPNPKGLLIIELHFADEQIKEKNIVTKNKGLTDKFFWLPVRFSAQDL